MKIPLTLLVAVGLLVAACGSSVVEQVEGAGSVPVTSEGGTSDAEGSSSGDPDGEPPVTTHGRTVRWESVIVEDLGHSLTVTFTGGPTGPLSELCNTDYDIGIEETADEVVLTVYELELVDPIEYPDDYGCNDVGYPWDIEVTPETALGDRQVVDGHDQSVHPVIDQTQILMPQWMPEGWVELYRSTYDDGLEIAFGPEDSGFPPLQFSSVPTDDEYNNDDFWRSMDLTTAEGFEVRNITGSGSYLVTSMEDGARTIVFNDGGRHYFTTVQQDVDLSVAVQFVNELSRGQGPGRSRAFIR